MGQENKGVVPEQFPFEVFREDFDLLAACHHLPLMLSLSPINFFPLLLFLQLLSASPSLISHSHFSSNLLQKGLLCSLL